jgi:hypothetical protein
MEEKNVTYLKAANKSIRYIILEQLLPAVILTTPSPHVLTISFVAALIEDDRTYDPHDYGKDEKCDSECGVIDCNLLRSSVASSEIAPEDENAHEKRYTGDGQESDLRPYLCLWCPCGQAISRWYSPCCVEDGKCGGEHGQDDETAGEVYTSKEDLSPPDPHF